ncbi:MAG: amidohydrolase family protein, partial [Acidimicrobiales bacterium]
MADDERYVIISADCHGGAELAEYRPYLERRHHDEFDAWAKTYAVPYEDLMGEDGNRNWDSERRLRELEADGIVAEVIFPNTIPPFYPQPSLKAQVPAATDGDMDLRWAGLRAHNRWLADFCAAAPGRRAGIAQIMLHDVDAAVAEILWAAEAGLKGGILLPGTPPGTGLAPLYSPIYDPIWRACEETGLPVNHHAGSDQP